MKVLHLLNTSRFSGAENMVCQIIGMFRNDPQIRMAYASRNGQIREALVERGVTFLPMKKLSIQEVRRAIHAYQPDVIHAHDIRASVLAAISAGNRKIISHIHVNQQKMRKPSAYSILYRLCARRFSHIFWVSRSALEQYRYQNAVQNKSTVLYNVVDRDALLTRMHLDSNHYPYQIVYIGRISAQKNPQRLVRVLEKVVHALPEVLAAIVGTGELYEETKTMIHQKGLAEQIHMLGFIDAPLKLLHDAKVMIMTSDYEGTPMAALEAMALGVPIVSTPTDGMCELIESGKTGYLEKDEQALAGSMMEIVTNETKHMALSHQSAARFEEICNCQHYKETLYKVYRT